MVANLSYSTQKEDQLRERAMAHFPAHTGQAIAALAFDPRYALLR